MASCCHPSLRCIGNVRLSKRTHVVLWQNIKRRGLLIRDTVWEITSNSGRLGSRYLHALNRGKSMEHVLLARQAGFRLHKTVLS